jgi:hypothetical protein
MKLHKWLVAVSIILGLISAGSVQSQAQQRSEAAGALSRFSAATAPEALIQDQQASAKPSTFATSACQSTFTFGSGQSFIQFCVTANGNITEFQSPAGFEHIAIGLFGEGYGICDITFNPNISYFDYAGFGDSGNWGSPVIIQPGGPNTFPLRIVRNTADNVFTLTQSFTWIKTERIVKIAMALRNNSNVGRAVNLVRYADIDANNTINNEFEYGQDSAWGYNHFHAFAPDYGLMLSTSPTPVLHEPFVQTVPSGPDPCNFVANLSLIHPFNGDGSVAILYQFGVAAGKTVTLSVEYRRF